MMKTDLNTGIRYLKGVGEKRAGLFAKLGIYTIRDLLNYFPRDYEDRRNIIHISEIKAGDKVCISAFVSADVKTRSPRRGFSISELRAVDETG